LKWTAAAQDSFQKIKQLLSAAVPLQHPSPQAELSLATDASDTHICDVMQQKSGTHWRPLGFFSRKMTDTESGYSTFDCKLLALNIFAIFVKAVLFSFGPTTNRLLPLYISRVSVPISPRQQRHLAFISEFNLQLLYLPALKNVVADFLSRPLPESTKTVAATAAADPVNFEEMVAEQNHFAEMQHFLGG
jgi:hypothetical protein